MRALNVPLPEEIRCADSVSGIARAIAQGAAVINMSYGSTAPLLRRVRPAAARDREGHHARGGGGQRAERGNPLLFPASLPHVLTVAAVGSDLKPPFFSSASAAVDLAAPGRRHPLRDAAAVRRGRHRDGYEAVTGTSFSAPMVAAAAAWLRAAKPNLKVDQVAQTLRGSARDLGSKGWDSATGFGLLSMTGALTLRDARRPTRTSPTTTWRGSTAARSGTATARSGAAASRSGCAR